ncbi:ABC transporter permease [Pseudodesulfovibrio sediminis]|uniref:ABC transporter permease n=1 Tax=Pseudodesulfovibrio sediminis TaxID=2810563 RepID=A0ABM7P7Z7_9BACT|nr:ABC transporter permease [Pseudodesulfovibrio sediminis]BCS89143.1 ABC transporter permease [Pseudodesulfovibrio sediminis]
MAEKKLPGWVNAGLIPVLNLLTAFLVSGLVILAMGENPVDAFRYLVFGAFGYAEAIGYTLFYATNFIFTGLAVAVAFHCYLFNIGGEGQAYVGGLGIGLVCLYLGDLPFWMILPLTVLGGALFGAAWAAIPAYLQAKRGSHIVITTIMFNFIGSSVMTFLLVEWLKRPGSQLPETSHFPDQAFMPKLYELAGKFGIEMARSPLNLSLIIALLCCLGVWIFIWRTRWGYEMRAVGKNPDAAVYGGISPAKSIMIAMLVSGALAGLVGLNELMGVQHRVVINFTNGYGFVGIAIALMGRNHPVGILLASLLMGALFQGGAEVAFEMPNITRDMIWTIQGFVILFTGALEHMYRGRLESLFIRAEREAA